MFIVCFFHFAKLYSFKVTPIEFILVQDGKDFGKVKTGFILNFNEYFWELLIGIWLTFASNGTSINRYENKVSIVFLMLFHSLINLEKG